MIAKLGSIPEKGFESDLARGACSPRHSRTVRSYGVTYTMEKYSEAIPGRDSIIRSFGLGRKKERKSDESEIIESYNLTL